MPELRKDWLTGQWVAFSRERLRRPLHFTPPVEVEGHEADPFCEGNEGCTPPEVFAIRPEGGAPDTPGWNVRVVPNRYPALRVEGELHRNAEGLYDQMSGVGAHEVVIETPYQDRELEEHSLSQISDVLATYRARTLDLMRDQRMRYISVFKNVGMLAGASQKHAHSQIIAMPMVPPEVERRMEVAEKHYREKERSLFADVMAQERKDSSRIIWENSDFMAFCPYASRFPFEVLILPKLQNCHYFSATDRTLVQLAEVLKKVLTAYRIGLNQPAYNLIFHTAPLRKRTDGKWPTIEHSYRWHVELIPRIFGLAGFELATACALNSVYPEEAARFLRESIETHEENAGHE